MRVETRMGVTLAFFMDFNWPYRNDADINISFNDVFALNGIISAFILSLAHGDK